MRYLLTAAMMLMSGVARAEVGVVVPDLPEAPDVCRPILDQAIAEENDAHKDDLVDDYNECCEQEREHR